MLVQVNLTAYDAGTYMAPIVNDGCRSFIATRFYRQYPRKFCHTQILTVLYLPRVAFPSEYAKHMVTYIDAAHLAPVIMLAMLKFDERGLIPAVVQDSISGRVLMLGWMNAESLRLTRETGDVIFFSRSRDQLWRKGETSGNVLKLRDLRIDCDGDTLLVRAEPHGPTCHTGNESCFFYEFDDNAVDAPDAVRQQDPPAAGFLDELAGVIAARHADAPEGSYTASLFKKGRHKISQKVGEEGLETAMAGVAQSDDRLIDESADLLFHLLVLLQERNVPLRTVISRLSERHAAGQQPDPV